LTATIASVASEFEEQASLLSSLRTSPIWSEFGDTGDLTLVGAGDSYAASLCASFLAGPRVRAWDPYALTESIESARGRIVCIISISGETKANIDLARALRGVANRTACITSNPHSRLAASVDSVVALPYTPPGKSPGIASFTCALAAALKVCGFDSDVDLKKAIQRSRSESKKIKLAKGGNVTHFVGNNEGYALSIYGAAKVYEFLGARAQASMLEEFSHMQVFSLSASDCVNVIESPTGTKGELLAEKLGKAGFDVSLIRPEGDSIERLYNLVLAIQTAAIGAARKRGLRSPYFLRAGKKLKISDEMIY
jgi:fructoselysine-6-P-deglycase FrlB-like protein